MESQVESEWNGWDGDTIVKLVNGTVWRQEEYHYEYHYAYRPQARVVNNIMFVEGMSKGVRVDQISVVETRVDGEWQGWDGETVVKLENGQIWQQEEYHYEYRYAYRPEVMIDGNNMLVEGMNKPIRVSRLR